MEFKDGKAYFKDGKWIQWYENGQKKSESVIVNNKANGKQKAWHENGQIESVGIFKDNKKEGKWSYWDENGVLLLRENLKDGERID